MHAPMSGMRCREITCTYLIALLTILSQSVEITIVQGPSNTTAIVNKSTYFNCSTSKRPVDERSISWLHFPLAGGGQNNYVYLDGRITTHYMNRFTTEKELSSGTVNLLALRLELMDAGSYVCKDDLVEDGASAELTVLDSDLVCESDMDPGGVVGPTQCDCAPIAPDELQLSCRVTYNGRNAPQMVWKKAGDSSNSTTTDCTITGGNSVTCNTTLTANLQLNGAVYYCDLTTQKYNCSLQINNILYAFATTTKREYHTGDEVTCVAKVSRQLPCSYQWYEDYSTEPSSNETLKPNDPGLYRCQAQCTIRNDSCTFTAMVISVTAPGSNSLHCLWLLFILAIVGVILVILYKCNLFRGCWCNKKNKRQSSGDNQSLQEELPMRPQPPEIPN